MRSHKKKTIAAHVHQNEANGLERNLKATETPGRVAKATAPRTNGTTGFLATKPAGCRDAGNHRPGKGSMPNTRLLAPNVLQRLRKITHTTVSVVQTHGNHHAEPNGRNASSVDQAIKMIAGTARSMGIEVVG